MYCSGFKCYSLCTAISHFAVVQAITMFRNCFLNNAASKMTETTRRAKGKNQSHTASVRSRQRAGPVGWMRCQQVKLYSDLILCTANQILGSAHPPSLKFRRSGQPHNGIESTSHWKSFVPLSKGGGGHSPSWTLLNSCTSIDHNNCCAFNAFYDAISPGTQKAAIHMHNRFVDRESTSLWCVPSVNVTWGEDYYY